MKHKAELKTSTFDSRESLSGNPQDSAKPTLAFLQGVLTALLGESHYTNDDPKAPWNANYELYVATLRCLMKHRVSE